ncbi:MAG: NADH-quinone oxidoreductase subunit L [Nitrospirales bacterium]|nr:MAG: NADH-quinone oxidoreductase subunit L [Nitrospirales bacterium]
MSIFTLIPLLPLFASLALVLGGSRWGEQGHRIGIPAIGLSFALSMWAFVEVLHNGPISISLYRLFQSGSLVIDLGMYLDQLTVLLLLLVTGVSGVVHVYSSGYMIGDPRYNRFFAVIALFTFSMLMLVSSSNLLMLFICWEIMGICSYLLISHWSERVSACRAATKAFLVNAVADVGLGFGIILTFFTFGTLDIQHILSQAHGMQEHTINVLGWIGLDLPVYTLTVIPICLLIGAMGKSAQMPFHVWLPFAMEAPTPVSALIHAATMVNAGPFLLIRLSPLIVLSPFAMTVIAAVGAITALFAAIVSLTQSDIKKVLAYSTISQIGFMIMSCGIGAFVAATFHLLAHGFLKAFLFLSTGNTLRTTQSQHHVETQPRASWQSRWTLYAGALTLACLPPFVIFSNPYQSVWMTHRFTSAKIGFWVIGLMTVFFTAMYLFRGIVTLFQHAPVRYDRNHPLSLSAQPQIFSPSHLLGLSVGGGIMVMILMTVWTWFAQFLTPALLVTIPAVEASKQVTEFGPWIFLPLLVAIGGWAYALLMHQYPGNSLGRRSKFMQTLYVIFLNKGYFDELIEFYIVHPTLRFANLLWRMIDVRVIDRSIHLIATSSLLFAQWLWRVVDVKGIDRAVMGIGEQSVGLGRWLSQVIDIRWLDQNLSQIGKQTNAAGQLLQEVESRTIQHQLLVMVFWLVLAIGLLYILV